jgi:dolichol-phosphate mannosyltransferase
MVPSLTVIIPAYNEAATIERLLDAVASTPYRKQVVVVDDGSTDATATLADCWNDRHRGDVEVVRHRVNRGKGAAIRTGLARARGEVVLVQDADLEYSPEDYPALIDPILSGEAEVVYGSRYLRPSGALPWTVNRICVVLLNFVVRIFYGRKLSDEATCYKAFRTELLRSMRLRCERFEFCPEVTAKACRMGVAILEVPVAYSPRSHVEGKKIRWWDGVEAFATLIRWRLSRLEFDGERTVLCPDAPRPILATPESFDLGETVNG